MPVRGLLGGAGGLVGALPVLSLARGLAERLAAPPRLPGVERAAGDLKSATWAEAAAIVLVLPAAVLFFGVLLPRWLESRTGRWFEWPGVAFAASLPLFRSGVPARYSIAAGLLLAAIAAAVPFHRAVSSPRAGPIRPPALPEEAATTPRWGLLAASLALLLVAGWRIYDQPGGNVDLFEDGHVLGPAQAYLAGGRPYLDTYPIHGWGVDGGLDAFFFRVFSPTLETFRLRRAAMTALGLSSMAAAAYLVFESAPWAAIAMLLAFSICPFVSERQTLVFAALAALAVAARRRKSAAWFLGGAISAGALFFTLDFGLVLLFGAGSAALLLGLADRKSGRIFAGLVAFVAGAAAGAAPLLARLAFHGSLGEFARVSFLELPASISDVWGLPAGMAAAVVSRGSASEAVALLARGEGMPGLFFLLLLGLAVLVLALRALDRRVDGVDRAALPAIFVSIAALRGVLGRADPAHLALYGVFAGLPAAWLLYRAAHAEKHRVPLTAALALLLAVRLRPDRTLAIEWTVLASSGHARAAFASGRPTPGNERGVVGPAQAAELAALRSYFDAHLAPGETFFDYSNEPALHFLVDRRPPVRYGIVPFYEPESKQREVIAVLERDRPPLAILSAGSSVDAPDTISNRVRTPLVADYLDRAYEPVAVVAGRTLARRRDR